MATQTGRSSTGDPRTTPRCDDVDRRLIELLTEDVRASNKTLAEKTGISVWTVANRLERLRQENILATTVAVDWELAGYHASGFAFLELEGATAAAVGNELVRHPGVLSAVRTFGGVDLVAHLITRDLAALRGAADELGDLPGVAAVAVATATEFHRIVSDRMILQIPAWSPRNLPDPIVDLDDLDLRLVARLIEDAHESNRKIAAELDVSESTVRTRLRRLEESGLFRVVAMFDPFILGEATPAYFAMRIRGSARRRVVEIVKDRPDVSALISCLGTYDLLGLLVTPSARETALALEEIRELDGVKSVSVFPIVDTLKHQVQLTRFLD